MHLFHPKIIAKHNKPAPIPAEHYTVAREYPVAGGRVDVALGMFYGEKDASKNQVLAPFELKGADTKNLDAMMPGRHKTPVQQAFEYARDIKGAQWVLLCRATLVCGERQAQKRRRGVHP